MKTYPISSNKRYSITKEYCGKAKPQYVVRFCDEFIVSTPFYSSALMRAVGHNAARMGDIIVEEVTP